jgi:hypothetical protein
LKESCLFCQINPGDQILVNAERENEYLGKGDGIFTIVAGVGILRRGQ